MKKRRAIIVCICILAAAAFTLALALPKKSYAASEEFAEIVNASSGAKRYIEEGILVPDEISDDTLGRIVSYFQEL